MDSMELVFKALADTNRHILLDALRERPGMTVNELVGILESKMTRFGVMKHLGLLEKASLISTIKVGRFKYHYLNPVPIQQIADRWIERYSQPWTQSLVDLKTVLERSTSMTNKPKQVYVTIIKASAEKIWDALTNPAITPLYYFNTKVTSSLQPGASFDYLTPDDKPMLTGKVIEAIKPKRLVTTFLPVWDQKMSTEKPTRVTYEIAEHGDCCKLTLIHDEFEGETETFKSVAGGWPTILSGLKTYLETGKPLGFKPMAA